ncbi:MAG: hypothetical protein ACOCQD_00285 [archaeon]
MAYCPLCVPQVGVTDDGKWVIVRYFPESEMDMDSMETGVFPHENGLHIIRKGWFKDFPEYIGDEEYQLTWETIHPISDWESLHVLDDDQVSEEQKIIEEMVENNKDLL